MIFTLYIVTHMLAQKFYVGWTSRDVEERWIEHKRFEGGCYFHNAIQMHGADAFEWEVVQYFDSAEEARQAEIYWIARLNTNVNRGGRGYNETDGGEGITGYRHTEVTRRKIGEASRAMGDAHPMKSKENRKKASDRVKALGDAHNMRWPEARERQANRMRISDNNPLLREEVREKTSERMKAMGDAHYVHRPWHRQKLIETSRTPDALAKRSAANRGEKNPQAKLTWTDVEFIRASSLKVGELAAMFGVVSSAISNIRAFKTWIPA